MRDLTGDEIDEYLRFSLTDRKAESFSQEQAVLIRDSFIESGFAMAMFKRIVGGLKEDGLKPEDVMMSLWIAAFQMGRECESRLITRALKGQ